MKYIYYSLKFLLPAFAFAFMLSCTSQIKNANMASDSAEIIEASGQTEYSEININEMREKAVYDAKINALRRIAEMFADPDYKAKGKADILEKIIYDDPEFFIKKYKIISEGQDRDIYTINIRLFMYPHKIASAIRAAGLVSPVKGPKAALIIEDSPASSGFAKYFYRDLSGASVMNLEILPAGKTGDGSYDALTEASSEIGAEMFIRAKANAYLLGGGMMSDFSPSAAEGSVEVIQVPSGKRLSDISRQGSASASSKDASISKAMENLSAILAKDTAAKVDPQIKSDPVMKLIFTGLRGIEKAENIKNDLLKMNFKYVSFDSYSMGKAIFSAVSKTQDTQEIASMVLRGETSGLQLGEAKGKEIVFTMY